MHTSDEAFQLAATYELGEPIRVYRTEKRSHVKLFGWVLAFVSLFVLIMVFIQAPFRFTSTIITLYSIMLAILLFVALLFLLPLLGVRRSTIYICSAGFILRRKHADQIVRWEEVEWVLSNNGQCVVYLANKQRVVISRFIGNLDMLAQEIELKARLVRRPEGQNNLEIQFEHLRRSQEVRAQERGAHLTGNHRSIGKETQEEASDLQEEYRLGEVIATFHGGFKGLLRQEAVGLPFYYFLLLAFPSLLVGQPFQFRFFPGGSFLASNMGLLYLALFLLSSFFFPRFFARFLRFHVYTEGFVLINGSVFEVVRWEQVEKIIYHKTMPILSAPLCHIYLTNGNTLTISSYIHERSTVKQIFDEHVGKKVEAG